MFSDVCRIWLLKKYVIVCKQSLQSVIYAFIDFNLFNWSSRTQSTALSKHFSDDFGLSALILHIYRSSLLSVWRLHLHVASRCLRCFHMFQRHVYALPCSTWSRDLHFLFLNLGPAPQCETLVMSSFLFSLAETFLCSGFVPLCIKALYTKWSNICLNQKLCVSTPKYIGLFCISW